MAVVADKGVGCRQPISSLSRVRSRLLIAVFRYAEWVLRDHNDGDAVSLGGARRLMGGHVRVTLRTEGLTITHGTITAHSPGRSGTASGHVRDGVIEIDDLAHERWLVSDATVRLHRQMTTAHSCVVAFRAAASRRGEPGAELDPGPLGMLRLVAGSGETLGIVLDDMTLEHTAHSEESCLVVPVGNVLVYRTTAPQLCQRIEVVPVHDGVLDVRLDS